MGRREFVVCIEVAKAHERRESGSVRQDWGMMKLNKLYSKERSCTRRLLEVRLKDM